MKTRTLAATLLALSLSAACAADEDKAPNNTQNSSAQSKEQAVRSADATGKLLALSNAALGGSGNRASAIEDLEGDIQAGVDSFITTLTDPACLNYTLDAVSETRIDVSFDFSDCQGENGLEDISGSFDVSIDAEGDDDIVDCDFEGDLTVDGYGFDGIWGIDQSPDGSAVVSGDFGIALPDGTLLNTLLDGLWRDIGTDCPSLTQHIEIGVGADAWSVDLSGLDMCTGSVCGSEIDLMIEGIEGIEGVDFSEYGAQLDGVSEGVFCGVDGDFVDYPELPGEDDLPGDDEIPGNDEIPGEGDF